MDGYQLYLYIYTNHSRLVKFRGYNWWSTKNCSHCDCIRQILQKLSVEWLIASLVLKILFANLLKKGVGAWLLPNLNGARVFLGTKRACVVSTSKEQQKRPEHQKAKKKLFFLLIYIINLKSFNLKIRVSYYQNTLLPEI